MNTDPEGEAHEGDGDDPLQALRLRRSKLDASEAALLRKTFSHIIKAQYDRVWALLQRQGLEPSDAVELAQESFLSLYKAILEEGYPIDLPERLNAIVKGKRLNYLRGQRRCRESAGLPTSSKEKPRSSQDPEREAARRDLRARLLAVLGPELFDVVEAVFLHGLTHEEAATLLGLSDGTLKGRIAKAKRVMSEQASRLLPPSQRSAT